VYRWPGSGWAFVPDTGFDEVEGACGLSRRLGARVIAYSEQTVSDVLRLVDARAGVIERELLRFDGRWATVRGDAAPWEVYLADDDDEDEDGAPPTECPECREAIEPRSRRCTACGARLRVPREGRHGPGLHLEGTLEALGRHLDLGDFRAWSDDERVEHHAPPPGLLDRVLTALLAPPRRG
jgi:hypothetical protein